MSLLHGKTWNHGYDLALWRRESDGRGNIVYYDCKLITFLNKYT